MTTPTDVLASLFIVLGVVIVVAGIVWGHPTEWDNGAGCAGIATGLVVMLVAFGAIVVAHVKWT